MLSRLAIPWLLAEPKGKPLCRREPLGAVASLAPFAFRLEGAWGSSSSQRDKKGAVLQRILTQRLDLSGNWGIP